MLKQKANTNWKVPHLSQAFSLSGNVGFDNELKSQIFSGRLACLILGSIFNPYRELKTCLQFLSSQFEKWRYKFFGGYFESILSTKQF